MYSLIFLTAAQKQFAKLDRAVARRIKRKLDWLIENIQNIEPEWLHSNLSGLAKLREGDFRVLYEVRHESKQILVHTVDHRSEVYKG
ncbi:MAG: type II toxin-antitoxin system RelE family toxin [Pyrinomonadaceae bacterium]